MTIGPDMLLMYNRKVAFDFDRGTIYVKQAAALDEAAEIQRYDDAIDVQFEDVTDPKTQPAQNALDPASGPLDPDALVSNPNLIDTTPQPRTALEDQALVEARRQEELAAVEGRAAENTDGRLRKKDCFLLRLLLTIELRLVMLRSLKRCSARTLSSLVS